MRDLLRRTVERHGQREALWYEGKVWTYQELNRETERLAAAFVSLGVRRGKRVALWAEIEPEVVFAYYGLQRIGAVAVLINTNLVDEEMEELLRQTELDFLVAGKSYKTGENLAKGRLGMLADAGVRQVMTLGETTIDGVSRMSAAADTATAADFELVRTLESAVVPEDTAAILFTSGSTSAPKGVMTSHYSRVNSGIQQADDLLCTLEDRFCVTMPVFHCFCISVNLMAALAVGGCLCVPRDRHINSILDTVEACRCTVLSSVPTMFHALLSRSKLEGRDLSSLRIGFIGGANYPPETFAHIEKALGPGFTLMSSLGQTECTAGLTTCSVSDPLEKRARTVGHFMNHVEGRIADIHTGQTLPTGQVGEICVRGYLVMQGYYGRPDLTAKTIDSEGWVHTGDLGILDNDGNLTLAGRLKELIIRGGENISPSELELILNQLPGVERSKVVGVPDEHYGEEICACVLPASGATVTAAEVRSFLAGHLAEYKIPKYVCFFDSFPLTATGKIKPEELRRSALKQLGFSEN